MATQVPNIYNRPMLDADSKEMMERYKQTISDAKRLKKELTAQLKSVDKMIEKCKATRQAIQKARKSPS
jgi:hypothetical protein